jgi:hypothetical protein
LYFVIESGYYADYPDLIKARNEARANGGNTNRNGNNGNGGQSANGAAFNSSADFQCYPCPQAAVW